MPDFDVSATYEVSSQAAFRNEQILFGLLRYFLMIFKYAAAHARMCE